MKQLFMIIICVSIVSLCGCTDTEYGKVNADVLTINSEILEGELVGAFLGSPSGWIRSDVIKVGVKFQINKILFLEDLNLSHSQLAYYKDSKTLPLELEVYLDKVSSNTFIRIRINGYYLKKCYIDNSIAENLIQYLRRTK